MNPFPFSHSLQPLSVACLLALAVGGCGKQDSAPTGSPSLPRASLPPSSLAAVEKTSFGDVAAQLDAGGNFYLYLSTAQWLDGLSAKVAEWRQLVSALPDVKPQDQAGINIAFDVITRLIKNSGVEEISGVGASGIALEKGLYHSKLVVHHYPERNQGALWSVFGKAPHPLEALDLLPATTAFAAGFDLEVAELWKMIQKEIRQAGIPEATQGLDQLQQQFQAVTGQSLDQLLASLDGSVLLVLTLDESKKVTLPVGRDRTLELGEPGLALAIKVKDDTLFKLLDQMLKANPQVQTADKGGVRMRTMEVPVPIPVPLRPTVAQSAKYIFLASSDQMVEQMLAVQAGKGKGLKSTEEFQKLSPQMPTEGNSFGFVSQKFGRTLSQAVLAAAEANAGQDGPPVALLEKLFSGADHSYSVAANTKEGWVTVANGTEHPATALAAPLVILPVGMLAAVAVPNFARARETAQRQSCVANLKVIEGAKAIWALENKKGDRDVPTDNDLIGRDKYIEAKPVCPQGGRYTLNAVGEKPACSIAAHNRAFSSSSR